MLDTDINPFITITKRNTNESIRLHQNNVKIREGQNKLMALSYKASLFDTEDLERFFDDVIASEKLNVDIGGTGDFGVSFRGIIEGKEKNFSQNIDHKILLLEEFKCPSRDDLKHIKRTSRFVPRGSIH